MDTEQSPKSPAQRRQAALDGKFRLVPHRPGVYLLRNKAAGIIYVGKARDLKKRLSAYLNPTRQMDVKTRVLIQHVADFDTIITKTEKEALILESTLIKRHMPRYNVILKDDKRYPSLCLDLTHRYPNLRIVRKTDDKRMRYFGPFSSAQAVRQTLKIVDKTFKLRKCKNRGFAIRTRPCLHHQMNACLGPCCLPLDRRVYGSMVKEVVLFLKGRTPQLIGKTRKAMLAAAETREYEKAAMLRDKLFALERTLEKQVAVTTDFMDRDVLAAALKEGAAVVTLLNIRGGYLLGSRHFKFEEAVADEAELVETLIKQYYAKTPFVPSEILIPEALDDAPLLAEWLTGVKGRKVRVHWPQRGEKRQLVKMARHNALNELQHHLGAIAQKLDILKQLQDRLALAALPLRIECFDNSNISGSDPVAGMVVFERGRALKSGYRRYRIRRHGPPDDYADMAEVLTRRYGKAGKSEPLPNLLMVDGGKGQLNIAVDVLNGLGLKDRFGVAALAKHDPRRGETDDKLYLPDRANPVKFGRQKEALLFLQQIRDETHRYAISFHRNLRRRLAVQSLLDTIPGVGPKRRQVLLKHFGSITKIKAATPEELSALPGMNRKAAEAVHTALQKRHLSAQGGVLASMQSST